MNENVVKVKLSEIYNKLIDLSMNAINMNQWYIINYTKSSLLVNKSISILSMLR